MKNILITLAALVLISGGTYFYTHTDKREVPKEIDQVVATTTATVVATTSASTTVTVTTASKPVPTSGLKGSSCGTVLDSHIFAESDKRTATEIKALACISDAAINCTPAFWM